MARCPDCYSSGSVFFDVGDGKCAPCYGTGEEQGFLDQVADRLAHDFFGTPLGEDCHVCHGSRKCQTCDGTGEVEEESSYSEPSSSGDDDDDDSVTDYESSHSYSGGGSYSSSRAGTISASTSSADWLVGLVFLMLVGLIAALIAGNKSQPIERNLFVTIGSPAVSLPARVLKLGTGLRTADDFCNAIQRAGGKVYDHAKDIMGEPAFTVSDHPTEIKLVIVTVAELGFRNSATREDIYAKAQSLGLSLCPPEVGPQLRLQYRNQSRDDLDLLEIGMDPIVSSGGAPFIFVVGNSSYGRTLSCSYAGPPGFIWDADDHWSRWVFTYK